MIFIHLVEEYHGYHGILPLEMEGAAEMVANKLFEYDWFDGIQEFYESDPDGALDIITWDDGSVMPITNEEEARKFVVEKIKSRVCYRPYNDSYTIDYVDLSEDKISEFSWNITG